MYARGVFISGDIIEQKGVKLLEEVNFKLLEEKTFIGLPLMRFFPNIEKNAHIIGKLDI